MARAITQMKDLPPEAVPVAERIHLLGFGWRYFPEHPLADVSRRVQVRDVEALAPPVQVSRYAQAMKNGDKFPPAILTQDQYLVDGATRTEAARRLKGTAFHAFVLDVNMEGSGEAMERQLKILGGSFNNTHGRGMSIANVERLVDAVSEDDDSYRDIARKLHIPESTVATVMLARKTRKLAEKLGVELNGTLTASHLKLFGGKIQKYTQPVWGAFLQLVQDAHMSLPQTVEVSKGIEAAADEPERMKILSDTRVSYEPVIRTGISQAPSRSAKLRQTLGYTLNAENLDLMVELDPAKAAEHSRVLDEVIERLNKVRAAQTRLDFARLDDGSRRTVRR